jgi:hypothetical protein
VLARLEAIADSELPARQASAPQLRFKPNLPPPWYYEFIKEKGLEKEYKRWEKALELEDQPTPERHVWPEQAEWQEGLSALILQECPLEIAGVKQEREDLMELEREHKRICSVPSPSDGDDQFSSQATTQSGSNSDDNDSSSPTVLASIPDWLEWNFYFRDVIGDICAQMVHRLYCLVQLLIYTAPSPDKLAQWVIHMACDTEDSMFEIIGGDGEPYRFSEQREIYYKREGRVSEIFLYGHDFPFDMADVREALSQVKIDNMDPNFNSQVWVLNGLKELDNLCHFPSESYKKALEELRRFRGKKGTITPSGNHTDTRSRPPFPKLRAT